MKQNFVVIYYDGNATKAMLASFENFTGPFGADGFPL